MKKMKFDPYSDLVGQALYQFSGNSVNKQYPYSHTEKDEIPQMMNHLVYDKAGNISHIEFA